MRQGDPLSPYLLPIRAKGHSSLLQKAESSGAIKGVAMSRGGIRISHLLFADDCVIFYRAKQVEWCYVNNMLAQYESASGQTLNKQKTSILFSSNTKVETRNVILQQDEGVLCNNYNNYLGLPTVVGRSKYFSFRSLKEKI